MVLEMRKKNIEDRHVQRNLEEDDSMFCFVEKKCGNGYEFIVVVWLLPVQTGLVVTILSSLAKKLSMGNFVVSCTFQVAILK